MRLDQQDHNPTELSGPGDPSHSIWDGFNLLLLSGREFGPWTLYDSGFQSSPGLECPSSRVLFRGSCPSQQVPSLPWEPAAGPALQEPPPALATSPDVEEQQVLMWKGSVGTSTKARNLRDVHGNLGNPALCLSIPRSAQLCPGLSTAGNHKPGTQCPAGSHKPQCPAGNHKCGTQCHAGVVTLPRARLALCKSSQASVCSQLLAIPPSGCSASLQ